MTEVGRRAHDTYVLFFGLYSPRIREGSFSETQRACGHQKVDSKRAGALKPRLTHSRSRLFSPYCSAPLLLPDALVFDLVLTPKRWWSAAAPAAGGLRGSSRRCLRG